MNLCRGLQSSRLWRSVGMRLGKDFYSGLILSVLSVWILFESQKIRKLRFDVLDNAFFPTMSAVLLLVFSVGLIIYSLLSTKKSGPISFRKPVRVALFLISFLVYIMLMEPLGFMVSSTMFIFISCLIISWPFKPRVIIYSTVFAFATSFSIWYVFAKLLRLVLP